MAKTSTARTSGSRVEVSSAARASAALGVDDALSALVDVKTLRRVAFGILHGEGGLEAEGEEGRCLIAGTLLHGMLAILDQVTEKLGEARDMLRVADGEPT